MTTEQLTKEVVELSATVAGHTEKMIDACSRLVKVEQAIEEQHKMLVIVERLANGVSNLSSKVDGLSIKVDTFVTKVTDIELKPAKRWETVVTDISKLAIAMVFGYLVSQLGIK